jgi:prepilin-type N-terminal cleavage/methylation domain-containing protein
MFKSIKNTKKGFTLIELLVVIAIIGILSSVVLASLSTARQKSRDAKRISDIGQVQLALELYFDASSSYPTTGGGIAALYAAKFLPQIPTPPSGSALAYLYFGSDGVTPTAANCAAVGPCISYSLGIDLERTDNPSLNTDADAVVTNTTTFNGRGDTNCTTATVAAADKCYDVKP